MGPKGKPAKGKEVESAPEVDPNEVVTELQKEFFEFQLSDIEKKLTRINEREEELTTGKQELEEKIEEFKKDRGAIVTEHEQLLACKEEEKCNKREQMIFLSDEIKIRIEKYKKQIKEMKVKYDVMVKEMTAQIEELEEEVRILEDYKQNRDAYHDDLDKQEKEINELEKEHQRNLFRINQKWEDAKGRVKKELQSRLLQLSIDFRAKSQKKIGNPCHRVTQENKAIHTMLLQMKEEILEYQDKCATSEKTMTKYKNIMHKKQEENKKMIARTVVQEEVIKTLMKDSFLLVEKLKEFTAVDSLNRNLLRRLQTVTCDVDRKGGAINDVNQQIDDKIEETNAMKDSVRYLKKYSRRLLVLMRHAIKIAEEAMAVRLIPVGGMEEEKLLTIERKIKLFRNRREQVFIKKGRILQYLLDFLQKAQPSDDDMKLLKGSSESIDLDTFDFTQIYGRPIQEQESKDNLMKEPEEEKKKGPVFYTSLTSLPRSVSALLEPDERKSEESEGEVYEGEFGEYEGYEITEPPQPLSAGDETDEVGGEGDDLDLDRQETTDVNEDENEEEKEGSAEN